MHTLTLLLFATTASASTNLRIYYTDTTCLGQISSLITVIDTSLNTCAPNPTPLPCEQKNLVTGSSSSEATACLEIQPLIPYFPSQSLSQGRQIPNAPYLYVNTYSGSGAVGCGLSPGGPISVAAYAATGLCYAQENQGNYFKARCDGGGGVVYTCSDVGCVNCNLQTVVSGCNGGMSAQCVLPSQIGVDGYANVTATGGSSTVPGTTVVSSPTRAVSSAGFGLGSGLEILMTLAILAAL